MSMAWTAAGGSGALLRRRTAAAVAATTKNTMRTTATGAPGIPERLAMVAAGAHGFHMSAARGARRRSRFTSVSAAKMGLVDEAAVGRFAQEHLRGYTAAEKAALADKYTPGQLAALEAGEAAVAARDLAVQGRLRTDARSLGFPYVDDFATLQPKIDRRPKAKAQLERANATAIDSRFMDEEAFSTDLLAWMESFVPANTRLEGLSAAQLDALIAEHGPREEDLLRWWFERPALVQRDGRTRVTAAETGDSAMAPSLGHHVPGVTHRYHRQTDPEDQGLDEAGEFRAIKRKTLLTVPEMQRMTAKVLVTRRVTNQTRLGKVLSTSVMAVVGNGEGRLGLGMAKSTEPQVAVKKAKMLALINMQPIPRYENRTIYGNVQAKVSGTVVQLSQRPPGFGLRVSHRIFEMARAAGIHDLAAKIPRSRNPMNTVKATFQALLQQRDPEEIAMGRGKKLVDVRKVYYGGAVN